MENQSLNESQSPAVDEAFVEGLKEIHGVKSALGSLTLLIVTVILFFSAGIISANWQDVLILILVLFIHELGHYVAMKILRYDDVKMFFLPFLGAAVSGKAKRETALKSCIVSLMGPFPGIVIGTVLYILFALTNNYWLLKTAQVMLLLNAFNFLPIMPLDGGRFLDVLFVKRRVLRLLFSLAGAAAFVYLAVALQDIFLGFIGAVAVAGAFSNFKIHGIAKVIESRGLNPVSVEELLEQPGKLQTIIDEMKARYKGLFEPNVNYRSIYNNLVVLIDTMKFIPAGIFSKLSLLFAYPVILIFSVAVTIFVIAADYKETLVYEDTDTGRVAISEKYMFGKLGSRVPVNDSYQYHGKGIAYETDSMAITDVYWYENGYRVGTWITTDTEGDTLEMKIYDNGKLMSIIKKNGVDMDTLFRDNFPPLRKMTIAIREHSQPLRSNFKHFE